MFERRGARQNHLDARATTWLGIEIDEGANKSGAKYISTVASRVRAYVVPTDEERMLAEHALMLLYAA